MCQLGARGHYAVANGLQRSGDLLALFTDSCSAVGFPSLLRQIPKSLQPNAVKRLVGRMPENVPPSKIRADTWLGVQYVMALARARSETQKLKLYVEFGSRFASFVSKRIPNNAKTIYAMNTECLELFRAGKSRGIRLVLEQTIAPGAVVQSILKEYCGREPDWAVDLGDYYSSGIVDRELQEWELADRIICGSQFVADGIRSVGGPVDKCVVVPYGIRTNSFTPSLDRKPVGADRRLRVLTVGSLGLRKGTHLILNAAKELSDSATFRLVGPGSLPLSIRNRVPENVEVIGQCPRSAIQDHFSWADVFLLPSLCEGSAMVTYEALIMGIPVICTPNTGSIVKDGKDGFLIPIGCVASMVDRLLYLNNSRNVLKEMSAAAFQRRAFIDTAAYDNRLLSGVFDETTGTISEEAVVS
ncbi:MAG: glycosyltransferase family 4 protein [Planctomycetota bacterium]|nr:glycosyltransferase family 4 protein [Planctomycetota bacterium]